MEKIDKITTCFIKINHKTANLLFFKIKKKTDFVLKGIPFVLEMAPLLLFVLIWKLVFHPQYK